MAIALTTFTDGTAISASDVNTNFTNIRSYVQGGLTNADLSGSAGITVANMAVSAFQTTITITIPQSIFNIASANTIFGAAGIPNSASNTYSVVDVTWMCSDIGTSGTLDFDVVAGTSTELRTLTGHDTIVSLTASGTTDDYNHSGTQTFSTSSVVGSTSSPIALAVVVTDKGTNAMSTADDFLTVSVTLQRDIV